MRQKAEIAQMIAVGIALGAIVGIALVMVLEVKVIHAELRHIRALLAGFGGEPNSQKEEPVGQGPIARGVSFFSRGPAGRAYFPPGFSEFYSGRPRSRVERPLPGATMEDEEEE